MATMNKDDQGASPRPQDRHPTSATAASDETPPQSPTAAITPTQRRVSFHSSSYEAPSRISTRTMESVPQDAEDTTDETTAIVGREIGGNKSYNTNDRLNSSGTLSRRATTESSISPKGTRRRSGATHGGQAADEHTDETQDVETSTDEVSKSAWKSFLDKYGSIELENKGSVARDHLALERTYLAWLRTSLAFASIGIAVTQLFRLNTDLTADPTEGELKLRHIGKPLGATFLGIGILTLLLGFHRYFESQHYVILGKFPASRGSVVLLSFVAATLIISSFVVILTVAPGTIAAS